MTLRRTGLLTAALALTLAAAACGGDDGDDNAGGTTLSGAVAIDGSSTVAPLSESAAELFEEENTGVNVAVGTSGTGGGFEKFCKGETDISDASRPIKEDETEKGVCDSNNIKYEQITVGNDALTVMVHKDNPVDCLTVDQLRAVWAPGSKLKNWSEIPGLTPSFNRPLDLYGPGTDSGTFDYFTDAINGEEGAQRTDYNNIGENDNTGLTGVQGSPGGMFYAGFTYYNENKDTVKALQIDGGGGCVAPSVETAQDGSYKPLARGLFIYPSDAGLAKPQVKAFVEFYINNNDAIAEGADAIPLTQEQKDEALAKIANLS
jgi:phosphate transport system substrate-binding protein